MITNSQKTILAAILKINNSVKSGQKLNKYNIKTLAYDLASIRQDGNLFFNYYSEKELAQKY